MGIYVVLDSKRPRLEQLPAANLDADDPVDDEVRENSSLWRFRML